MATTWCDQVSTAGNGLPADSQILTWEADTMAWFNYAKRQATGLWLGVQPQLPSAIYLAVATSVSTGDTPGDEYSGNGYVRKEISLARANSGQIWNDVQWSSGVGSGSWLNLYGLMAFDSEEGGNPWGYVNFASPVDKPDAQSIIILANQFIVGIRD